MKHSNRGLNHHKYGILQEDQASDSHYVFMQPNEANQTQWENSDLSDQVR